MMNEHRVRGVGIVWRDATAVTALIGSVTALLSTVVALVRAVRAPADTLDGD
jgi:hypothetical protein